MSSLPWSLLVRLVFRSHRLLKPVRKVWSQEDSTLGEGGSGLDPFIGLTLMSAEGVVQCHCESILSL